jgi:hypothetical protein
MIDNPQGRTYTIKTSDVLMITYKEGAREVIVQKPASPPQKKRRRTSENTEEEEFVSFSLGIGSGRGMGTIGASAELRFGHVGVLGSIGWLEDLPSPSWEAGLSAYFLKIMYFKSTFGVIGTQWMETDYGSYTTKTDYKPLLGVTEILGVNIPVGNVVAFNVGGGIYQSVDPEHNLFGFAYELGMTFTF